MFTDPVIQSIPFVILFAAFWIGLNHRASLLAPFLIAVVLLINLVQLFGQSPLGFFSSWGGWLYLGALSWVAAALVRIAEGLWKRHKGCDEY